VSGEHGPLKGGPFYFNHTIIKPQKIQTMATLLKGLFGGFSGRIGNVVGYRRRGRDFVRSRPKRRKRVSTPGQLAQRAKFSLMMKFLSPICDFIGLANKNLPHNISAFSKIFSLNVRNAITGNYPACAIDYSKVILSMGRLPQAATPSVDSVAPGKLVFTWADNSGHGGAQASDKAFIAVFSEGLKIWILKPEAAMRKNDGYILAEPAFRRKSVHCYIGFISEDGNRASTSLYARMVKVL
jgi:Family of unknown function (DUF6266)